MKLNKLATYVLSALAPTLLLVTSAAADPTTGPIYGAPVTMNQAAINLSETLNADSSGWVVSFDQYDQSGLLAQYTVTTDTGDSCTVLTAATDAQESCTVGLVNNNSTITPTLSSVTYDPVVAMAGGVNPGGVMPLSEGATTTTIPAEVSPISLDTTNVTVTDNGDGTFTLAIPAYSGSPESGSYTFTTSAGDTCTNEVAATATAECTITPSDGQQPIVDSVTWYPIVATDIRMYSMARADNHSSALSATSGNGAPTGGSSLWAAGIIAIITTLGVFWLNSRARRRSL